MRVDLSGGDISVAEKLLHGSNVVAALEQMGGEAVPQRVAGGALADPRASHRFGHRALNHSFVQVVPVEEGVLPSIGARGRKDPPPAKVHLGVRVFLAQRVGHGDADAKVGVALVYCASRCQLIAQRQQELRRNHRTAVLSPLAATDGNLVALEIDIFDAQRAALQEAQAGTVEQRGYQGASLLVTATESPSRVAAARATLATSAPDRKALARAALAPWRAPRSRDRARGRCHAAMRAARPSSP